MRLWRMRRVLSGTILLPVLAVSGALMAQAAGNKVLAPADLAKLFPATVYYCGQTAPAQLRNSGGVRFADGHYVLASLVDTGGYSTDVAAKYQGYLITEVPLKVEGKHLAAGAYGIGFVGGGRFVVTDLGGADVFRVDSATDEAMKRPRPLQVADDAAGGFRLYVGRRYVHFSR
ncbi:MAG TPA: hypothetical protein VMD25_01815 [Acidobacteriaceae bacterium]|nr:hypothetical protein [Acidobacteriaceae bacterium]